MVFGDADPLVGRVLGDKFRLDRKLGAGASGAVYRAYHLALAKPIAIKVLHASHGADPELTRRFAAEARAAARFDHPNSVQILDFGEDGEDRLLYIAMEFLAGEDLQVVLTRERALPTWRIAAIMGQVASALALAHEQGIIHRDLKPSNIMLVPDVADDGHPFERVKVCDFGLAKILDVKVGEDSQGPLTKAGVIFGTPAYMAPEQAQGEPVDHRADIYAAGVIMFRMVTGDMLFTADSPTGVLIKQIMEPPRPTRDVVEDADPRLAQLIDACLQKEPGQRPASMRELLSVLRELADEASGGLVVPMRAPSAAEAAGPPSSRPSSFGAGSTRADPDRPSASGAPISEPVGVPAGPPDGASDDLVARMPAYSSAPSTSGGPFAARSAGDRASLAGLVLGSMALVLVGGLFAYVLLRPPSAASVAVAEVTDAGPGPTVAVAVSKDAGRTSPAVDASVQVQDRIKPRSAEKVSRAERPAPPAPRAARAARAPSSKTNRRAGPSPAAGSPTPKADPRADPLPPALPVPVDAGFAPPTSPPARTAPPRVHAPPPPVHAPPPPVHAPPPPVHAERPDAGPPRLSPEFTLEIRLAEVHVSGGLSSRKVKNALNRHLPEAKDCVRAALAGGVATESAVQVTATIGFGGKLESIDLMGERAAVVGCLKASLRRARMPRPDTGQALLKFSVRYSASG